MKTRMTIVSAALFAAACSGRGCGWGSAGVPAGGLPAITRDGRSYTVLDKGAWKGFYDAQGRLAIVEYDSNGDRRADYIAHYDESKRIRLIEVDEDNDAWVDRWEHYGPSGVLEKVGRWRKKRGKADEWTYRDADGHVGRVETDADRDGRMDRWQTWSHGRLVAEALDTNGDGKPDRRLTYGRDGRLTKVERVDP